MVTLDAVATKPPLSNPTLQKQCQTTKTACSTSPILSEGYFFSTGGLNTSRVPHRPGLPVRVLTCNFCFPIAHNRNITLNLAGT